MEAFTGRSIHGSTIITVSVRWVFPYVFRGKVVEKNVDNLDKSKDAGSKQESHIATHITYKQHNIGFYNNVIMEYRYLKQGLTL